MLKPVKMLDPENQAKCQQNGWIALDPNTGSTLRKVEEGGKATKYFLYIPGVMLRVIWAKNDLEAIAMANNGAK